MSSQVTVIDIGIGNLASALKALVKAGAAPELTSDPAKVLAADKLILPGVGAFGAGMAALSGAGLVDPIREAVLGRRVPIIGFCMGMQLFATRGYEGGEFEGLGLVDGEVRMLDIAKCEVLPHMGWNNLEEVGQMRLFQGLPASPHFYFVHSYHFVGLGPQVAIAHCLYGEQLVTAAIECENIYGTQFHPEKSLANGIHILKKFIEDA